MKCPLKNTGKRGFTLIEMIVYLAAMSSVLFLVTRFEVMGRKVTALHYVQSTVLSLANHNMERITNLVREAEKVEVKNHNECRIYLGGKEKEVFYLVWKKEKKALHSQLVKGGKEKEEQKWSHYLNDVEFTRGEGYIEVYLHYLAPDAHGGKYSLKLKRKIHLKE